MRTIKMRSLVDVWSVPTLILFSVLKTLQLFRKLGFRTKEDSWRKVMRPFFLTEYAKFTLAAFGIDFWSDLRPGAGKNPEYAKRHLIERLAAFLGQQPTAQWKLTRGLLHAKRSRNPCVDIIHAEFDDNGRLKYLEPHFDRNRGTFQTVDQGMRETIIRGIIEAYNNTVHICDKARPTALAKEMKRWLHARRWASHNERADAGSFTQRVLSGAFIHFDDLMRDGTDNNLKRFDIPDFTNKKHPGFGLFNIHCRFGNHYNEAELWFQVDHVLTDGALVEDMIKDLKKHWGICGGFAYPSRSKTGGIALQPCSREAESGIYLGRLLVDFRSLLKSKRELSRRYDAEAGGAITLASMLVWGMARTGSFSGIKFLVPVDFYSSRSRERTLGHVIIRPDVFFRKDDPLGGFLAFQREFNRRLQAAKEGNGEVQEMLDALALNPSFMNVAFYKLMPSAVREFFGDIGISILKESDLFVSPLDDVHTKGFIAIGKVTVPTEDGGMAGWVTAKGRKDEVCAYLNSLFNVAQDFSRYL